MREDWASKYVIRKSDFSPTVNLDEFFGLLLVAALALLALAVPALIVWWLVQSGLFQGVAALAAMLALALWMASLAIRILCCRCR